MSVINLMESVSRHRYLAVTVMVLCLLLSAGAARLVNPRYVAQATVLLVAEPTGQTNRTTTESPIKPILSADLPLLATTPTVLMRVASDIGMAQNPQTLKTLATRIKAKLTANSSVLLVLFTSNSERQATAGANAVASEVVNFYRETATGRFDMLVRDLTHQIHKRRLGLRQLNMKIQRQSSSNPSIDPKDGLQPLSIEYAKLLQARDETRAVLLSDRAAESVVGQRVGQVMPLALKELAADDPFYKAVRQQLGNDRANLNRTKSQYTDLYPDMVQMRRTIERERASLARMQGEIAKANPRESGSFVQALGETNRIAAIAAGDAAKLRGIDQNMIDVQSKIVAGGAAGAMQAALISERISTESAYTVIFNRLADAVANKAEASSVGSVAVMDRALYAQPGILSRNLIFYLGAVLSLCIAFTLPLMVDSLENRFRNPQAIEGVYHVPVIAKFQ